jgi:hypothetical protein
MVTCNEMPATNLKHSLSKLNNQINSGNSIEPDILRIQSDFKNMAKYSDTVTLNTYATKEELQNYLSKFNGSNVPAYIGRYLYLNNTAFVNEIASSTENQFVFTLYIVSTDVKAGGIPLQKPVVNVCAYANKIVDSLGVKSIMLGVLDIGHVE